MYTLSLSPSERQAIDFVGHRYWHGNELFLLLNDCQQVNHCDEWADNETITWYIPEYKAWEIREHITDDEGRPTLDLFAPSLVSKLMQFCDEII